MFDKDVSGNCDWCDVPLTRFNHADSSVCSHCYGLLENAGLSHTEITKPSNQILSSPKLTTEIE